MNAERLLKHYEHIANAPNAIARLRRFILDLAVRGKLVPQDASDEPASELLTRIAEKKARAGRREKVEPEIDSEEELGELPPTWRAVPLIALGSWAIGSGFPKNEQGLETGPHFFLKVSDMNLPGNEKFITTSNNFIDDDAARRIRAKIHPPGTIIFPKIGGAIATNKRRILTRGSAIDNNCLGITFASELDVGWAFLLLTTLDFTRYQAGTAVPALQQGVLERIPVGLPPLAEQHRIVAKVDELMALCDRLEEARAKREATRDRLTAASLARLNAPDPDPATFANHARFTLNALPALTTRPDQIKQLRQTILNLAVRGKLVEQDPNEDPVARRYQKELGGGHFPPNWRVLNFGKFCNIEGGNQPPKSQFIAEPRKGYVRLLQIRDLGERPVPVYIPIASARSLCKQGEILIGRYGASVGKVFWAQDGAYNVAMAKFIWPEDALIPGFAFLLLKSEFLQGPLANATRSAQAGFNKGDLAPIDFPLPPLAEQHRIVAKVNQLMTLCDQLEANLTTSDDTRRRLLDALLAEALTTHERQDQAA